MVTILNPKEKQNLVIKQLVQLQSVRLTCGKAGTTEKEEAWEGEVAGGT